MVSDIERLRKLVEQGDSHAAEHLFVEGQRRGHEAWILEAARALLIQRHALDIEVAERAAHAIVRDPEATPEELEQSYRILRSQSRVRPALDALARLQPDDLWAYCLKRWPQVRSAPEGLLAAFLHHLVRRGPCALHGIRNAFVELEEEDMLIGLEERLSRGWLEELIAAEWIVPHPSERLELGPRMAQALPLRPEQDTDDLRTFLVDRFGPMRDRDEERLHDTAISFGQKAAPMLAGELGKHSGHSIYSYNEILDEFCHQYGQCYPSAWRSALADHLTPDCSRQAVEAMGWIDHPLAIDALLSLSNHDEVSDSVLLSCIDALGCQLRCFGVDKAQKWLNTLLQDPVRSVSVHKAAYRALARR